MKLRIIQVNTLITVFAVCSLIFSLGCKPQRVVSEKVITHSDSSAVLLLKDSLHKKDLLIANLKSDLKLIKTENINLQNETATYQINYDTSTPTDSISNRPAVISEVFTVSKSIYDKSIKEYQMLLQEASIEIDGLTTANSNLKQVVSNLQDEKSEYLSESDQKGWFGGKAKFIPHIATLLIFLTIIVSTNISKHFKNHKTK
ncbi:MAG: hypothetical protein PHV53_07190 [Fermentimonas sp.]|nr:hypothetical protein [Fermentimonas sp.]